MLTASLLTAAPTADLSVDLDAWALPFLTGVRYDVSVTNHGPDAVTSATVVVQLEQQPGWGVSPPCALPAGTKTITCTFGAVPVGGTVTVNPAVYYALNGVPPRTTINATATRTASTPADPNAANDIDTRACQFHGKNPPQQSWPPEISC